MGISRVSEETHSSVGGYRDSWSPSLSYSLSNTHTQHCRAPSLSRGQQFHNPRKTKPKERPEHKTKGINRVCVRVLVTQLCPTLCDSMDTVAAVAHQALLSMEFSGKNTGVGCHFLLQGIFLTQESKPGLPGCRQTLSTKPRVKSDRV